MSEASEAEGVQADAPEAPETNPVLDRVEQLAGQFGEFRESILGRLPEPDPEPEPDDPWAALYADPEPEPEQAPQLNIEALRAAMRAELDQELSARDAEIADLRTTHDLQALYEKHPDLKDPEVKQATGQAVQQLAARFEQRYGQGAGALIANDPEMIALVHQAQAGQRAAAAEVAAEGDPTQLEGGGGVAPGGVEQPSIVARVMSQRRALPKGFRA